MCCNYKVGLKNVLRAIVFASIVAGSSLCFAATFSASSGELFRFSPEGVLVSQLEPNDIYIPFKRTLVVDKGSATLPYPGKYLLYVSKKEHISVAAPTGVVEGTSRHYIIWVGPDVVSASGRSFYLERKRYNQVIFSDEGAMFYFNNDGVYVIQKNNGDKQTKFYTFDHVDFDRSGNRAIYRMPQTDMTVIVPVDKYGDIKNGSGKIIVTEALNKSLAYHYNSKDPLYPAPCYEILDKE